MDTHRRAIITAFAALCAIAVQRAPAQSSGSFAGDFVGGGVNIISTITCSSGAALSCVNGGSAFLGATIKMPGSRSKYLWISASLETALWTQTGVTGGTGKIQTSTATGSILVTPEVRAPNGALVKVWPPGCGLPWLRSKISGQRAPSPRVRWATRHNESCTPFCGASTTTDSGCAGALTVSFTSNPRVFQ